MLLGIFLIIVILMMVCILAVFLITRQKPPAPTPEFIQPIIQVAPPPVVIPPPYYQGFMPVLIDPGNPAFSAPIEASAVQEIWKVSSFEEQAYELDGSRYDMATFIRFDSLATLRGYCIDPGLDAPAVGTEYVLSDGTTLIPLQQPATDPLQRFTVIP